MAVATAVFGMAECWLPMLGQDRTTLLVVALRLLQGVTAAMYLSTNTTLITRHFSDSIPYVLGMVEVCVGCGSQLGRLFGGILYDFGGFACPFAVLACIQAAWGALGFQFQESQGPGSRLAVERTAAKMQLRSFLTARNVLVLLAVFSNYFIVGFMDATAPGHLERYLGPLPIWTVSLLLSLRSLTYLFLSYICAHIMHRGLISYEQMLAAGAGLCVVGLTAMGPTWPIGEMLVSHSTCSWAVQIASFIALSSGLAATFIPALPLMQSEVRHLGGQAVEEVAQLFIAAMSLGEAIGPIVGGALSIQLGFADCAMACAAPMAVVLVGSALLHDPRLAELRAGSGSLDAGGVDEALVTRERLTSLESIVDGECAFQIRRVPYALRQAQEQVPPGSAPALVFRRRFSPRADSRVQRCQSAPSGSFRKPYRG